MKKAKPSKPCTKCPYKKGLVKYVANPCPECRANGYRTYYDSLSKLTRINDTDNQPAIYKKGI